MSKKLREKRATHKGQLNPLVKPKSMVPPHTLTLTQARFYF